MENSTDTIYKYIRRSVSAELEVSALLRLNRHYESKFRSNFYSIFAFMEKGQAESILKLKNENIKIKRSRGTASYIPREVYVKSKSVASSETNIAWSGMNFNIFGSLDLLSFFEVPFLFDCESSEKIKVINQELYNLELEKNKESIHAIVKCKRLCLEMLELILALSPFKKDGIEKLIGVREFFPVINYINGNYQQKISNSDLARMMHLSLSRFIHKFKFSMGVSPQQYIQQRRFLNISRLLASTNLRINEIASEHGFSSQFHFSNAFKSATGYSPQQYRKLLKEGALFCN